MQLSAAGGLNALDMSSDGHFLVTGGGDKLLKVVTYDEGQVTHVGQGHSGAILRAAICPNQQYLVSVTASGSIFRWSFPHARDSSE